MKTLISVRLLALSALLSLAPASAAQHLRVAVGTNSVSGGDYATVFEDVVTEYQQRGVQIGVQRMLPTWVTAEAEGSLPVLGAVEIGARVQVARTQADALYGDPSGTLDVRGTFRSVFVEPEIGYRHQAAPWLEVGASVHAGVAYVSSSIDQQVFIDLAPYAAQETRTADASGSGLSLGGSVRFAVPVGPVAASLRLGGRWAKVRGAELAETLNGTDVTVPEPVLLDHDLSGFTATIGIGI